MGALDQFWQWLQNEFWLKLKYSLGFFFGWFNDKIQTMFNTGWAVLYAAWSIVLVFAALGAWAIGQISDSLSHIDLQAIKTGSGSLLQYGAFINRFIPLTEAASVSIIVFNIWLAVTILRWIKSFVPFVSN
ncbi:hypothetical protein [Luteolibacter soli]|uniref:DUF2523 domain-containing protein n=1 Tax=Luteolibacter soli TaxID=3135280 RepID=A0ABU9AUS9_9BACT